MSRVSSLLNNAYSGELVIICTDFCTCDRAPPRVPIRPETYPAAPPSCSAFSLSEKVISDRSRQSGCVYSVMTGLTEV